MANVPNIVNPPRDAGSAPGAGNMAQRTVTPPVQPAAAVPAAPATTPRRNSGGFTILSNNSQPAGSGTPPPKRQSGPVALPQTPAQPHATPIPAKRQSGPQMLPPAPQQTPLPRRNSGPVPLPYTPPLTNHAHTTPLPAKRQSGPQPLPTLPQQTPLPRRNSGPVPLPTTPMQQLNQTPRRQSGGVPLPNLQDHATPIPRRQSGPIPLPNTPSQHATPLPRRQSGPQMLPGAQLSAPAMYHHYPDVHAKSGPAPMSPLSPMAPPKPQNLKRQSGPQPVERRKTPPVLPASPSPLRQSGPQVIERRKTPPVLESAPQPKRQSGPQSLTAPLSVPAPAASGSRRGTGILPRNAPSASSEPRERYQPRWYIVHVRTVVLSVCVAAALAYLNFRPPAIVRCQTVHKDSGDAKTTAYVTEIRGRGWPLTQSQTVETSDPILAMQTYQKEPPKPIGAKNILICLAMVLGTGLVCEFLARRSDATL